VSVDFLGLGASLGEELRYEYKLEGAGNNWVQTNERTVNFANLAPGTYRLLVRAVNADGVYSPQPATVSLRLAAPVWRRWWFLALAALAAVAAVHLSYRYRTARLLELERVRTRIATDLHDDIGASLSRIAILSEVAVVEGHNYKTAAATLGVSVSTVAFHMRNIYDKLQVHSKSEAVAKALQNRLV
jgi:predicted phage tail protein